MNKTLIGIFGGTFDPVHLGHINAVEDLQAECQFESIFWVLSARPPHKNQVSLSVERRFEVLQLALSGYDKFIPDDTEIKRPYQSWTIDTVTEFRQRFPQHHPCLIIGADSLTSLPSWHRYQELVESASFLVMARPGYVFDLPQELEQRVVSTSQELKAAKNTSIMLIQQTDYDISSTQIRDTIIKEGADADVLQKWLPTDVIHYIQEHQSYTIPPMQVDQIKDQVVDALEDVKAHDIRVLDIGDISDFADYMVVASGTSDTHVKALAREASDRLRQQGVKPLNEDGRELGEWVLVDFGDVVLHVMRPEVREYYDLEKLWDEDVRELVKQHREQQEN